MTPRNRHSRTGPVPYSDFGGEEFYDEDDLEELDEAIDAADLAAFDAEAIDEDEESRLLTMRERAPRAVRTTRMSPPDSGCRRCWPTPESPRAAPASSSLPTAASASTASPSLNRASGWTR